MFSDHKESPPVIFIPEQLMCRNSKDLRPFCLKPVQPDPGASNRKSFVYHPSGLRFLKDQEVLGSWVFAFTPWNTSLLRKATFLSRRCDRGQAKQDRVKMLPLTVKDESQNKIKIKNGLFCLKC